MERKKKKNIINTFLGGVLFKMSVVSHIPSCNIFYVLVRCVRRGSGLCGWITPSSERIAGRPIDNRFHLPSWRPLASSSWHTVFDSSPINRTVTLNNVSITVVQREQTDVLNTLRASPLPGPTDSTSAGKTAEMESRHISGKQRDNRLYRTRYSATRHASTNQLEKCACVTYRTHRCGAHSSGFVVLRARHGDASFPNPFRK